MALIRLDHYSESVKMNLPLNIVLPEPAEMIHVPMSERKVLYLLHGLSDDCSAWQRFTSIELYARKYGIIVIMPSAGRSFYTDQFNGQSYFTYLVDELPGYLNAVFNLQPKRERTLIAGLSMGGYGAFKAAFLRPERYHAAGSFSGPLMLGMLSNVPLEEGLKIEFTSLFGDLNKIAGSEHDPITWLDNRKGAKKLPRLYASCGSEDELFGANLLFRAACQKRGIPLEFQEAKGRHDWYFWDAQIKVFLEMMLGGLPGDEGKDD